MKKYQIILADPPWSYEKSGGIKSSRGLAKKFYPTMKLEDIKRLPIQWICDKNCYLFLWVTAPRMPEGIEVLKAWGFEYFTVAFTWIKTNISAQDTLFWGMGNSTRANPEFVLLGRKGKLQRVDASVHSVILRPVIFSPRQEHSKKPAKVRLSIERLYGDLPRIELFARPQSPLFPKREGWDVWGNEVESDIELEVKMEKPEKKTYEHYAIPPNQDWLNGVNCGYNKACDNWETYHNWKLSQLPGKEEIENIINEFDVSIDVCGHDKLQVLKLTKAIAKRIGK